MPRSPQDIYARHLLSPRGYPLWTPEPSHQLLAYRRDGLRIGDVGVVIPEDGCFDVFFNLCLPHDHLFHQATGVPDNFKPVQLTDMDIRTVPNAENPGRIIATSSVKTVRSVERAGDSSSRTRTSGMEYEFNLSSSEGALLILPEGAERRDLRNYHLFLEAAVQHGADWYRFAEEKVGQIISHDSLYLITGLYKTFSWSLAAFEKTAGSGEYPVHCTLSQVGGGNVAATCAWSTTRALDWRVGPIDNYGIPNQAVFIRGFKIARRTGMFGTRRIGVMADAPSTRPNRVKHFGPVPGKSWMKYVFGGQSGSRSPGSSQSDAQEIAADPALDAALNKIQNHGALAVGEDVVIHRVPGASQESFTLAFHPSDIINRYLLDKEPSANVVITHDDEWIAILEKHLLQPEDLARENLIQRLISQNYHVFSKAGAAYLRSKSAGSSAASNPDATMEGRECDSEESVIINRLALTGLGDASTPPDISKVDANKVVESSPFMGRSKVPSTSSMEAPEKTIRLDKTNITYQPQSFKQKTPSVQDHPTPSVTRDKTGKATEVIFRSQSRSPPSSPIVVNTPVPLQRETPAKLEMEFPTIPQPFDGDSSNDLSVAKPRYVKFSPPSYTIYPSPLLRSSLSYPPSDIRKQDHQLPLHHFNSIEPEQPLSPLSSTFLGGESSSPLGMSEVMFGSLHEDYGSSPPGTGTSTSSNTPTIDPTPNPMVGPSSPSHAIQYSFVSLPGNSVKKRPRRRYDELERLYHCSWQGCTKAYGTLNHLNAHISMQKHGPKRSPNEFKELRKQWRKAKKEEVEAKALDAVRHGPHQQPHLPQHHPSRHSASDGDYQSHNIRPPFDYAHHPERPIQPIGPSDDLHDSRHRSSLYDPLVSPYRQQSEIAYPYPHAHGANTSGIPIDRRPANTTLSTSNILIVGETGVGKSSVINLIAGEPLAEVNSGVCGSTLDAASYDVVLPGDGGVPQHIRLFDTVGLNDPQLRRNDYLTAIEKANTLICQLQRTGGIRLLLFCFRGGRITAVTQNNYRLFSEILCQNQVPVAFVITGLENEPSMEGWWEKNVHLFEACQLFCQSHACVTAIRGLHDCYEAKYHDSQTRLRAMLLGHVSEEVRPWKADRESWFIGLAAKLWKWFSQARKRRRRALTVESLARHLEDRCKFSHPEAIYLAGRIHAKRLDNEGPDFVKEGDVSGVE